MSPLTSQTGLSTPHPEVEQLTQSTEPANLPMAGTVEQWIKEVVNNGLSINNKVKFGSDLEKALQDRALQVLSSGEFNGLALTNEQRTLLTRFYDILKEKTSGLEAFLAAFREKNKLKAEMAERSWDQQVAYTFTLALLGIDVAHLEEMFGPTAQAMELYRSLKARTHTILKASLQGQTLFSATA